MTDTAHKASFFRQSGWLMIANIAGGMLMWGVHFLSKRIGEADYGLFVALLAVVMCIPTMPLQMALTHQTALALATNRERQLAGMIRMILVGTFVLWVVGAGIALFLQPHILAHWQMSSPVGLWITLGVVLLSLWLPVFWGVLQGQQGFLWLGSSMMLNGVGRLAVAVGAVFALSHCTAAMLSSFGGYASGMMLGALFGLLVAAAIAGWQTRQVWLGPSQPFDWRNLLREIIPPMLGFAAFQFLFTADTIFVKNYFTQDEAGFYGSAGTLSRALMWLVGPLASVMFPRIVHSTAKSEKSNLVGIVLWGTAFLAASGAVSLSLLSPWIVPFVYKGNFVPVATAILPWYAGAMVPLAVANVLLNNLLARSTFKVVIPLCLLAAAYGMALTQYHSSLVVVLKTMGVFNVLLLLICAWFTWRGKTVPNAVSTVPS